MIRYRSVLAGVGIKGAVCTDFVVTPRDAMSSFRMFSSSRQFAMSAVEKADIASA